MIQNLELSLKETFDKINQKYPLLSANIVGSYGSGSPTGKTDLNEIDLYVVFDVSKLSPELFNYTAKEFSTLCHNLTALDREKKSYTLDNRFGPFEPQEKDQFQIHLLIDDIEESTRVVNTIKWNWVLKNTNLVGKQLSELDFFQPRNIHRRDILTCYGGIKYYIEDIQNDIIPYAEWVEKEGIFLKERRLKTNNSEWERLHFMEHVCIISLKNVIRYLEKGKQQFYHDRETILAKSKEHFFDNYEFILALDQRSIFTPKSNVNQKVEEAITFLKYLVSKVPP